ncbi:MAG: hypothetical protein NVS9B15_20080 [Acidobacteriaceae bacterium]
MRRAFWSSKLTRLLLVIGTCCFAVGQQFEGSWHAELEGKTFVTLRLAHQGDGFTGVLHHSTQINTSEDGRLLGVSGRFVDEPVEGSKAVGNELHFNCKDEDDELTRYVFRIVDQDTGELRFADVPKGVTAPKPFTLKRTKQ